MNTTTTTITVMGATGHTGMKITHRLLKSGVKVRALGRSAPSTRATPSAATAAYIAWNRFTVEAGAPEAFLAPAPPLYTQEADRRGAPCNTR